MIEEIKMSKNQTEIFVLAFSDFNNVWWVVLMDWVACLFSVLIQA